MCVCVRVRTVQKFQCRNPQVCYIKVHLLSPRLCSLSFFLVLHFFSLVQVVGIVKITTLNNRQYCVILDPVGKDGKPQLGQKKLIKGERSFFLSPGERLEKGTQNVYVLEEDEGLILKANEAFTDADTVSVVNSTGQNWFPVPGLSSSLPFTDRAPFPLVVVLAHIYAL